jgi:hypothetical protein
MALNNAAADAALDVWIDGLSPPVSAEQKESIRSGMRPLIRAIYAGIVANAVVLPGTMAAGGDPVTGAGTIS